MGRGRQKAKHTKVARELKYFSPDTNYASLERELASASPGSSEYDKWVDEDDDELEDDEDLEDDEEEDDEEEDEDEDDEETVDEE